MKPQKYYEVKYDCNHCQRVYTKFRSNYERVTPFVCACGSVDVNQTETETEWSKTGRN